MVEALWTAEFVSSTGRAGIGVAVFDNGRLYGGDTSYFFIGSYTLSGDSITVDVHVTHYAGLPSNIFGPLEEAHLSLSGTVTQDAFTLTGHTKETKDKADFKLTRQAELS